MKAIIGRYGFVAGLALAVVVSFMGMTDVIMTMLVVLGLVVGLLNVTGKETVPFLVATIALIAAGTGVFTVFPLSAAIESAMSAIVLFVSAAAVPVVFRALFTTLKDE